MYHILISYRYHMLSGEC